MPSRSPVREEHIRVAVRTSAGGADRRRPDTRIQQLPPIGLDQIEMQLRPDWRVPRRPLRQKQHGIFGSHRIRIEHLSKQLPRVAELRFKLRQQFLAHRIAALRRPRPNRRDQVLRFAAELQPHTPHTQFHNPLHCSAPPCMKRRNYFLPSIGNQHGDAVCRLDRHQQSWHRRNHSVRFPRSLPLYISLVGDHQQVRVKLPQRHDRGRRISRHRSRQQPAVLLHGFPGVRRSESQIQLAWRSLSAVGPAHSTSPRTEPVPKPLLQAAISEPRTNLKQLHPIRESRSLRCSRCELFLRGRVSSRLPESGGNACRRSSPIAHQSRSRKYFVDVF